MKELMNEWSNKRVNLILNILNTLYKDKKIASFTESTIWTIKILEFFTQMQDVRVDDATSQSQNRAVEASSLTTGESSVFTI